MCKFVNLFSSHNAVISISYCWKSNITRNVFGISVVKDALSVSTHFLLRYTFSELRFRQLFLDFHRKNLEIELMSTSVFVFVFVFFFNQESIASSCVTVHSHLKSQ